MTAKIFLIWFVALSQGVTKYLNFTLPYLCKMTLGSDQNLKKSSKKLDLGFIYT